MNKIHEKYPLTKRYTTEELRQRITLYVQAGGLYPISPTGVQNIARRFYTTPEQVRRLICEVQSDSTPPTVQVTE